ncbi:MAG: hypothetical protein ACYDCY_08885 [Metallibacterium sp.]
MQAQAKSTVMIAYDRSKISDMSFEEGIRIARESNSSLYITGICSKHQVLRDRPWDITPFDLMQDDLIALFKIGQSNGVNVDGKILIDPSILDVAELITRVRATRIVCVRTHEANGKSAKNTDLLVGAAQATGVPVTVITMALSD